MKKNLKDLTYSEAFLQLEAIVSEIESDEIQLDTLAEKVHRAKELISFCETKLRSIRNDIDDVISD